MTKQTAFTLPDVLVNTIVIGILAGIALPGYQGYIQRSHIRDERICSVTEDARRSSHRTHGGHSPQHHRRCETLMLTIPLNDFIFGGAP